MRSGVRDQSRAGISKENGAPLRPDSISHTRSQLRAIDEIFRTRAARDGTTPTQLGWLLAQSLPSDRQGRRPQVLVRSIHAERSVPEGARRPELEVRDRISVTREEVEKLGAREGGLLLVGFYDATATRVTGHYFLLLESTGDPPALKLADPRHYEETVDGFTAMMVSPQGQEGRTGPTLYFDLESYSRFRIPGPPFVPVIEAVIRANYPVSD